MRQLLAALFVFCVAFSTSAAAAPLRLSGRILPPVPADLRIELDPAIPSTAEEIRRLAGFPAPPLATARPRPTSVSPPAPPCPAASSSTARPSPAPVWPR